ncbi:MAG: energy transducer TonB [Proteobacteria bacterium]|nr:energy transducer TonB [Pseudomonadota bacterium]
MGNLIDFVHVKQERNASQGLTGNLERRQHKSKKPPPPDEPPPNLASQKFNVSIDDTDFSMQQMDISVNADISSGGFGISDGDYLPIVKVQAPYPRRALSRRMTGWVILELTVTEQGTVSNPFVVENCGLILDPRRPTECVDSPNSIFDSAVTKAALKYKYKPKIVNGKPVAIAGVRNKIIFELTGVT